MPNSKISALTSATTPLAGTETVPVVQSSTTKQVSVANLTAGRAVSASSLTTTTGDVTTGRNIVVTGAGTIEQNGAAGGLYFANTAVSGGATNQRFYTTNASGAAQLQFLMAGGATPTNDLYGNLSLVTGNLIQGTAAKGINFTANTPAAGMTSQLLNWYEEGTWTPTSFDITYAAATGSYTRIGRQVFAHFSITLPTTSDANNITIVGLPFTVANTDQMRTGAIGYTDYGTACTLAPVKNTTRGNIFKFDGVPVTNANASGKVFAGVFIYNV